MASAATDISTNPEDYEYPHCDQFGIGPDGKPVADNLTGTGSDVEVPEHDPDKPHKMTLTQEEQDILNGSKGPVMAKVLETIVRHGELFGAERLADCGGRPHSSLYTGGPWVAPVLEMFEEIADAGLKAFAPYTVNPMVIDLYTTGRDPVKRNMELDGFPLHGSADPGPYAPRRGAAEQLELRLLPAGDRQRGRARHGGDLGRVPRR